MLTGSVGRSAGTFGFSALEAPESTTGSSGPFSVTAACLLDSQFANVGRIKVSGDAGGHSWEVNRLYGTIGISGVSHAEVRCFTTSCFAHTR